MDDSDYDPEVEEVQDGIDRPTSENNPIRMAERESIFPSFLNTPRRAENNRSSLAKKDLKNSEKNAEATNNDLKKHKDDGAVNKLRNLEKNATPGGIVNNVVGKNNKNNNNNESQGGFKLFVQKKGALVFLLMAILGGVTGASIAGQGFQGFSLVNNIIQNNNVGGASLRARVTKATYSLLSRRSKPTTETKKVYKEAGIELNTDDNGLVNNITYEDRNGVTKTINNTGELNNAFDNDATFNSRITKTSDILDVEANYGKTRSTAADRVNFRRDRYNGYYGDYDTDVDDPSKPGWLDLASDPELKTTLQSGGYYDDNGNISSADDGGKANYDGGTEIKGTDYDELLDDTVKIEEVDSAGGVEMSSKTIDVGAKFTKAVDNAKGSLSMISTASCIYSAIAQGIAIMTIAKQMADMINIASGFMEGTQKCQAGDGNCTSMKKYLERFSTGDFWEATSIQALFGAPGASGQSTGVANLQNVFNNKGIGMALEKAGVSRQSWQFCTYSKLIANGFNFMSDVIGIFTGGLTSIFRKLFTTAVIAAVVTVVIGAAMKGVIKVAARALHLDVITEMGTKTVGDYVTGGGGIIFDTMGKADGLSASTATQANSFREYQNEVIASRALYDRENLSPFDISSPNTFLGSLVESMVSFSVLNSASSTPLTKLLSATSSIVTNSIVDLLPQAAASTYENIANEVGDCPITETVDAVGTANHCRDFVVADTSTFNITYEEAVKYLTESGDLDEDGNIMERGEDKDHTSLAAYVTNWTQRDTPVGLADSQIQQRYHKYETGNAAVDGALGQIPLWGDYVDMVNARRDIKYQGQIFGSDYVAGNERWAEDQRYMQAFVGLDSAYNTLGLIEESAVAKYLDKYYAENPIDNSYEGVLARFSGLPKSEVIDILAYMDYMDEVAQYDPEERLVFAEKLERPILIDSDEKSGSDLMLPLEEIAYFDLRSKSYAI